MDLLCLNEYFLIKICIIFSQLAYTLLRRVMVHRLMLIFLHNMILNFQKVKLCLIVNGFMSQANFHFLEIFALFSLFTFHNVQTFLSYIFKTKYFSN